MGTREYSARILPCQRQTQTAHMQPKQPTVLARPPMETTAAPSELSPVAPGIRPTLAMLVVLCVLPVFLMSALLLMGYYQHEQEQLAKNTINRAQSLAMAVDRELAATQSALLALGTSHRLATGDLAGFHRRATEALPNVRADNILVIDRDGQIVLSTRIPFGEPLPKVANPKLLRQIQETGQPGVSDLFMGPIAKRPVFTVAVPVTIDNAIVYTLNAVFTPEQFATLLSVQGFPESWRVAITDSSYHIVARSHELERFMGRPVTADLLARMRQANEGSMESVTLDGIPVLTAFSKSAKWKWGVAVGIPKAELTSGLRQTLMWLSAATIGSLALGLWLAWFVGGRVAGSIRALTRPAVDLASGMPLDRVDIPTLYFKEANAMRDALLTASHAFQRSQFEANHDALTGLPNRTLFHHAVAQQLALCQRNKTELCILFIDLDGFKAVNDTWGHATGDHLLQEVSLRITNACRRSDIAARLGGDEFALALLQTELEQGQAFANRLVEQISQPYVLGSVQVEVSASIGVSNFPHMADEINTLLHKADQAMYSAKSAGKRCVRVAA